MAITLDGSNGILSPDFEPSSSTTPTNGLFLPAANALGFATNSTERLRLNASGNLGLGVTPSAWVGKAFEIGYAGSAIQTSASGYMRMMANTYQGSGGNFYYAASATKSALYEQNAGQHIFYTAGTGTAGNAISFTQAMTLDASGNLGIGTTSLANGRLSVVAGTSASGYSAFFTNLDGTYNPYLQIQHSSGGVKLYASSSYGGSATTLTCVAGSGGVYLSGSATSWAAVSDEREKDFIENISNAVAKVESLRAVIGKYKDDEVGTRRAFLFAQDALAVFPEAVDITNPDKYGLRYTDTIPLLVAAIKELTARLEALEAK